MAVGAFLLWQLAHFRCGSWRISVVAVGGISLWQLARLSVLLIITESNMTMIIKDDAKLQKKRRERRVFFGKLGVLFENSKVTFDMIGITKLLHSYLSR